MSVCVEYFVVFIDDMTHYVWIYVIKHKHEVFQKFQEWKSFVSFRSLVAVAVQSFIKLT